MEKQRGKQLKGAAAGSGAVDPSSVEVAPALLPTPLPSLGGARVLTVSNLLKLALPPLFVSSLPRRAIGFSLPRGKEGALLGAAVLGATVTTSYLATTLLGAVAGAAMVWAFGGTGAVMIYNSVGGGLMFVKHRCSTCRLRPIIEEHELMHLNGESSEEAVWREAKKKYTYDGLGLGTDPKICGFCPIAARLKESR